MGIWRFIIGIFIQGSRPTSGATEQLIQKLSESYFIRRPAQLTAYFLLKGKDKILQLKDTGSLQELNKKAIDLKREIQDELQKAKDNFKK